MTVDEKVSGSPSWKQKVTDFSQKYKLGAFFQKYLAGEIDRAGFADEITAYWATAEVGAH